jgi:hypothetical protein
MTSIDFTAISAYLEFFEGQTIWHIYAPFGNAKLRSSTIFLLGKWCGICVGRISVAKTMG